MAKRSILLLALFVVFFMFSCDDNDTTNPDDNSKTPLIKALELNFGPLGSIVTIRGVNFASSRNNGAVYFNGTSVSDYISWCDSQIVVRVPSEASSGPVYASINEIETNSLDFTVKALEYESVQIGDQIWMTKNLDIDYFRNGDPIRQCSTDAEWGNAIYYRKEAAWCYYDNNPENGKIYGKLYNCYAVSDSRELAPEGWHIPNDTEWKKLETYLGMSQKHADSLRWRGEEEGGMLKATGNYHESTGLWIYPNTGATNSTGFTALPGGYRHMNGPFLDIEVIGQWYSSTAVEKHESIKYTRKLSYDTSKIFRQNFNIGGFSVRCVKD